MYNKYKSKLGIIISECDQLKDANASFTSEISTMTNKYRTRFTSIVKRTQSEENKKVKEEHELKLHIKLHNFLSKQIIDSTTYDLLRPNRKALKYKLREETVFDKNPVMYLKHQLLQEKQRSQKLSLQARNFSIQQQKFVQRLDNYKDYIGLK